MLLVRFYGHYLPVSQYSGKMKIMNLQGCLSKLTDVVWGGVYIVFSHVIALIVVVTWQWDLLAFMQIHM